MLNLSWPRLSRYRPGQRQNRFDLVHLTLLERLLTELLIEATSFRWPLDRELNLPERLLREVVRD